MITIWDLSSMFPMVVALDKSPRNNHCPRLRAVSQVLSNGCWEQSLGKLGAYIHGKRAPLRWVNSFFSPPTINFLLFWFHWVSNFFLKNWTFFFNHWGSVGCAEVYANRIFSLLYIFLLKRWMQTIHLTCLPWCCHCKCTAL